MGQSNQNQGDSMERWVQQVALTAGLYQKGTVGTSKMHCPFRLFRNTQEGLKKEGPPPSSPFNHISGLNLEVYS